MTEPNQHPDTNQDGSPEEVSTTRRDWEQLPSDPDLHDDLGYELLDLESYETDEDHVLFLPKDEDMIRDEAFMVARKQDVHSLGG